MRCASRPGLITAFAILGLAVPPAAAQMLPIELVLSPPRASPVAARGTDLTAPPLPPSFQPRQPAVKMAAPAPVATRQPARVAAPKPAVDSAERRFAGPKPGALPAGPRSAAQPVIWKPVVLAAVPATPARRSEPLSERDIVERANAYFTNLDTLIADFIQIGGDGRRVGGTLYLQRPGKARFEYEKPSSLEVVADGSSVAVRDTRLATQDLYPISQTPLKFLLRERFRLGDDVRITAVAHDGDAASISLEDTSMLGGTSRITLFFDPQVEGLSQWRITDPQGFHTTVMLDNVHRATPIDQRLFAINYDRAIPDNLNR
jgi:outer membrane lipoprotein-sorting protein